MKKAFLMTTAAAMLTACATTSQTGASATNIVGMYYANLPCVQKCSGVIVDLVLEPDNTYSMISHKKNSTDEYCESGTWANNGISLTLTKTSAQTPSKALLNFKIKDLTITDNNKLILLNTNNKQQTNDVNRYMFEKK